MKKKNKKKKTERVLPFTGNVVNGTIGKQMVDTLVESASNVEVRLLAFGPYILRERRLWEIRNRTRGLRDS